jgi:hypothetical protein
MNIVKYLLSGNYRENLNEKYTKEICEKFLYEEMKHEEIYGLVLNNLKTDCKKLA